MLSCKKWSQAIATSLLVLFYQSSYAQATVQLQGLLTCAPMQLTDNSCELSAVTATQDKNGRRIVYAANDKTPAPPQSALIRLEETAPNVWEFAEFVTLPSTLVGEKYEAMTTLPNHDVLISTAFHKAHHEKANQIVVLASQGNAYRLAATDCSDSLRDILQRSLQAYLGEKPDFFKVEGLAAVQDERLLLGIREIGLPGQAIRYTALIVELGLKQIQNRWQTACHAQVVADFTAQIQRETGEMVGLSSVEVHNEQVYFLTSYENPAQPTDLHSYLWFTPVQGLGNTQAHLVRERNGHPLILPHKAEGMTWLGDNQLLVVHDDDRQQTGVRNPQDEQRRQIWQSPYTILHWSTH